MFSKTSSTFNLRLLVLICTLVLLGMTQEVCENQTHMCPCGSNKNNMVRMTVEMCLREDLRTGQKFCQPCYELYQIDGFCFNFRNCLTCANDPSRCSKCPRGRFGRFCEITHILNTTNAFEIVLLPGETQSITSLIGQTKQKFLCPRPTHLTTAEVRCVQNNYVMTCFLSCVWGYSYPDGTENKVIRCNANSYTWQPFGFEECTRRINCELELKTNGSLDCTIHQVNKPDQCTISCDMQPATNYSCIQGGLWRPVLPSCVQPSQQPLKNNYAWEDDYYT